MIERKVTRRYVQGFIQAVQGQDQVDAVEQALKSIDELLKENKEFKNLLYHPTISRARKKDLLRKLAGEKVPPVLNRFTDFLIEKKRERILEAVYGEFKQAADELRGIVRVKIHASHEMTQQQVLRIQAELERSLNKRAILEIVIDRNLLGGLQIMIGTHIFDGSVSGRLNRLHKYLQDEVSNLKTVA